MYKMFQIIKQTKLLSVLYYNNMYVYLSASVSVWCPSFRLLVCLMVHQKWQQKSCYYHQTTIYHGNPTPPPLFLQISFSLLFLISNWTHYLQKKKTPKYNSNPQPQNFTFCMGLSPHLQPAMYAARGAGLYEEHTSDQKGRRGICMVYEYFLFFYDKFSFKCPKDWTFLEQGWILQVILHLSFF